MYFPKILESGLIAVSEASPLFEEAPYPSP